MTEPAEHLQTILAVIEEIRGRLKRYRELISEGKFSEAGREIEKIQERVGK